MHLKTLVTLGLGSALLTACGDDEEVTTAGLTASGGGTETDGGTDSASSASESASVSESASASDSDSDSDTATATAGTDSAGTDSAGTDSAGTDSAGTDSAGTDSAGTDSAGTDSAGTDGSTGGTTTTDSAGTGNNVICEAPGEIMPCDDGTADPFNAIGLNCPFGENAAIPISNEVFTSPEPEAWRIGTQFGTYIDPVTMEPLWSPREGDSFLIISSGRIPAPDVNGLITMAPGVTQFGTGTSANPDNTVLPAPMSPSPGSNGGAGGTPFVNCDGTNDCSDSINDQWILGNEEPNDLLWFQFETVVPGGTFGYSFEFAYFSAEFPEYVNSAYNDMFLVWSASETYTGNLCFVNDNPCTVTALFPEVIYTENSPELVGTGFDTVGQSPGWFTGQGTAAPGENLQLTFTVFDMNDTILDTAVILDNFAWDCEGCVPSEVDPCVGIDPV